MQRQVISKPTNSIRRRRQDQVPREKTSLNLRSDMLEAAKEIVQSGQAESVSAVIESAVEEKVRRTRRAALYAAYEEAAQDAEFVQRMNGVSLDFEDTATDDLND